MPVLDEVVEPHLGHLAVDVAQVFLGDGDPFRLGGGAGGGGVEDGFAGEEDVALAVFVAFHVGAQGLVVVHGHLLLVAFVEFRVVGRLQDVGEVVFTAIDGILGVGQDVTEGLFAGFARVLVGFHELAVLDAAGHTEQEIRDKGVSQFFHKILFLTDKLSGKDTFFLGCWFGGVLIRKKCIFVATK